jgi:ubiquinone/menaquinone biosynthesis C-methylase UbiE
LLQLYRKSQLRPRQQLTFAPEATETLLRRVGIQRGMRHLDLGCGTGETFLLLAKLVGPSGLVVGIDPSAQAIDLAERRATIGGQCYWTRFVAADLDTFVLAEPFDALIVRLELFYRREPLAGFLRFSSLVRAGGVVVLVSGASVSNPSASSAERNLTGRIPHRHRGLC